MGARTLLVYVLDAEGGLQPSLLLGRPHRLGPVAGPVFPMAAER